MSNIAFLFDLYISLLIYHMFYINLFLITNFNLINNSITAQSFKLTIDLGILVFGLEVIFTSRLKSNLSNKPVL